jgi:hypothetical protein
MAARGHVRRAGAAGGCGGGALIMSSEQTSKPAESVLAKVGEEGGGRAWDVSVVAVPLPV